MMKKYLITVTALFLSACGFTPMHAPQLAGGDLAFKNIRIDMVEPDDIAHDRGAFYLQQALYDRLGTSGNKHILSISPKFTRAGLGISSQDVATRYDIKVSMPYTLKDAKSGDVLDSGNITALTTFAAPIDPYGREASEQTATENIARNAADKLLVRLAAYYSNADK